MQSNVKTEAAEAIKAEHNLAPAQVPTADNLLEVPPAKLKAASFPPGCNVLFSNIASGSLVVSRGTVEAVYIDLTPGKSSRDFFYKLSLSGERSNTLIVGEEQLQWAPQCPVSMKPGKEELVWKDAIIVGSYQSSPKAEAQYSVQEIDPGTGIFHGVTKECLRYRPGSSSTIKANPATVPQASPAMAKPDARSSGTAFESPTSVMESLAAPAKQVSLPRPDPLRQVSDIVSEAVASRLKRPSEQPSSEASVAAAKRPSEQPSSEASVAVVNEHPHKKAKVTQPDSTVVAVASETSKEKQDEPASLEGAEHENAPPAKEGEFAQPTETSQTSRGSLTSEMLLQKAVPKETKAAQPTSESYDQNSMKAVAKPQQNHVEAFPEAGTYSGMANADVRTLTINIPLFADPIAVTEAIIGSAGRNHKRLLLETGCQRINLDGHNPLPGSAPLPMKVTLVAHSNKIESAQRMVEDAIVNTVCQDQRARMLFYLAVENDYGASEGLARYQRSPIDSRMWCWMAIVEVPVGFERCSGLFMDRSAKAVKDIIAATGCRCINLSSTFPKHIYLWSEDLDAVNAAAELVEKRVKWTLQEYEIRRQGQYR